MKACILNNPTVLVPTWELLIVPSFIGNNYFCDTGNYGDDNSPRNTYYTEHPLWDDEGCGSQSVCCSLNSPPWFYKQLSQPSTDDIEMRLCCDQDRDHEDIQVEIIHINFLFSDENCVNLILTKFNIIATVGLV